MVGQAQRHAPLVVTASIRMIVRVDLVYHPTFRLFSSRVLAMHPWNGFYDHV
jgi:hypothetical protein